MAYYATNYEITARHPDGRVYLVGYTPRHSRAGLLSAILSVGPEIVEAINMGEDDELTFTKAPRWTASTSGWKIGFTGRTLRDIKHGGETEHTFIARRVA